MKHKTLFSFLTVAALGATTALGIVKATPVAPVSATTFTWDGDQNNGDWRDEDNWDVGASYPQSGDIAIITTDGDPPVINDQDEVVSELRVQTGAILTITGQKLTLDGTTAHDIDGDIKLSNGTAALKFSASVTVDGDGNIIGEHNDAKFQIAGDKTLTNEMIVKGQMQVKALPGGTRAGKFVNGATGTVLADADGNDSPAVLLFAVGLAFDDVSGANWQATTDPDAVLKFDVGAACLDGDFLIDGCATIQLNGVSIDTRGSYTNNGGLLDLVGAVHFGHSCNAGCSSCTTFTTDQCVTGALSCSCP